MALPLSLGALHTSLRRSLSAVILFTLVAGTTQLANSPRHSAYAAPLLTSIPLEDAAPYTITPSSGVQGKEYEVSVSSSQCLQSTAAHAKAAATPVTGDFNADKANHKDYQLYAPDGSGIQVTTTGTKDCFLTARLKIAADAPLGAASLWLKNDGTLVATITFTITGITAGPIPPGLNNKGQVDVMWYVLPDQQVHDDFGPKVASEYYCIEAVIGNDSGYDLQLASIGFTVPFFGDLNYKIPSAGYRVVRATLQHREQFSPRTFVLNGLKITGPLMTGFTPFFHNAVHRGNFAEFINVISNPLEKGFELIVPDPIPGQLDRLADQTFRDDISTRTIIPNNIQARIMTFVPKQLLFWEPKGSTFRRMFSPSTRKANAKSEELRKRNEQTVEAYRATHPGARQFYYANLDRNNPQDVMKMLGDIVLIGQQVDYVNRVRVVASGLTTIPSDTSVSGRVTDACNLGVPGVTVTLNAGTGFTARSVTTDSSGNYTFPNVPLGRTYTITPTLTDATFNPTAPGIETFTLNDTKSNVDFNADLNAFTITAKVVKGDGSVLSGVTWKLNGSTITAASADNNGYVFKITGMKVTQNLLLEPSLTGFSFAPTSTTYNCQTRTSTFKATPTPTPKPPGD